jgi:hypothetical protein
MPNGPQDAPWAKPKAPFYSHPDFVWFSAECPPDYCLMVIDRAGTIRFVNHVRPDQEIDQVLGGPYVDQFAESDRPDIKLILDRVFSDAAETVVFEATGAGQNGTSVAYKTRIQPLMANDAIPYALLMFVEMSKVRDGDGDGETLTVCAWTNRVKLADEWLPLEAYLKRKYGLRISHGMSPEAHQMMAEGVFDPGTSNVPGVEAAKSRLRRTARVFLEKPKKPDAPK